jgi:hypothetical protein
MPAFDREHERDAPGSRPPEPVPAPATQPGSLEWASALGNQAVQRLARQSVARDAVEEEAAPEEAEEAPPPEVEAMTAAGIGPDSVAGLAALDDLPEDHLPE